jgi:16S rRNA C1402 (ribose-2'-O) methylase RsmI
LIFLESPYRIVESLEDILSVLGDRRICVAREMTKMFEEYWRGTSAGRWNISNHSRREGSLHWFQLE